MTRGRPIGNNIRQVCLIVEAIGPCRSAEIWPRMVSKNAAEYAWRYCQRAVEYGLMTADKSLRQHIFTIVPEWRELLNDPARRPVKAKPAPSRYEAHHLQSIWNQGASA